MILPTEVVKATNQNPKKLFIFSSPKVGKTTAVSMLENCLIIDLEKGSKYIDALKVQINSFEEFKDLIKSLNEANAKLGPGKYMYKYIAIDTMTALEELAKPLALELYKQTALGKAFKGGVPEFMLLPNGAAYGYLRNAFEKMYNAISNQCEYLILLGHLKKSAVNKANGMEISARDIDLTGKLKGLTCQDVDAIGYMYRKGKQVILHFESSEDDTVTGARPTHLRNASIVLTEEVDGKLVSHWDKIFLPE